MNELARIDSLENLVRQYLRSLDIKPRSRDSYHKGLRHFLDYIKLQEIKAPAREDIRRYKDHLLACYSSATVSSYLTAVRGFFAFLEGQKLYPNVAAGIKGAKAPRGFKKAALTAEQALLTMAAPDRNTLEGKRDYALVNLLVRTGLRTIEVQRANVEDIQHEGGAIKLWVQGKGRDSKDEFVILTESTLRPVREYLKDRGVKDGREPLFMSCSNRNKDGRLTTRSISRIVKTMLQSAGLDDPKITAHSLRHTAITLSLLGGATLQEAQAMARHSSITTTQIYTHNLDRIQNAAELRIDALLG